MQVNPLYELFRNHFYLLEDTYAFFYTLFWIDVVNTEQCTVSLK